MVLKNRLRFDLVVSELDPAFFNRQEVCRIALASAVLVFTILRIEGALADLLPIDFPNYEWLT